MGTGYILCPYLVTPPQFHVHCTRDFIVLVSSTLNLLKASFSDERGQTVEYCRLNFPAVLCLECTDFVVACSVLYSPLIRYLHTHDMCSVVKECKL